MSHRAVTQLLCQAQVTVPPFMGEMTGIWKSEVASGGISCNSKGIVWGGGTLSLKSVSYCQVKLN